MKTPVKKLLRRDGRRLNLSVVILWLGLGVMLPVLLSTTVGIVGISMGTSSELLVIGILVLCFAAATIGGAITVFVLLGRKARLARLQVDLLDNVSHELRTPLSSIRLYTQTLVRQCAEHDPDVRQNLETILRETEWLESMIDRMLAWRSASRDRDLLDFASAPLGPAVQQALDRFGRMTQADNVKLQVVLDSRQAVEHDPRAIATVVLNLLVNAYKYTGEDKRIALSLTDEGGQVVLRVADNGIGMSPKAIPQIFEPFFRAQEGMQQHASGAGLGLAIVKHLTQAHRGKILVDSSPGKGSTFTLRFVTAPVEPNP